MSRSSQSASPCSSALPSSRSPARSTPPAGPSPTRAPRPLSAPAVEAPVIWMRGLLQFLQQLRGAGRPCRWPPRRACPARRWRATEMPCERSPPATDLRNGTSDMIGPRELRRPVERSGRREACQHDRQQDDGPQQAAKRRERHVGAHQQDRSPGVGQVRPLFGRRIAHEVASHRARRARRCRPARS